MLTEVEVFNEAEDKDALKLACGYGAVFGRNENKAIAMAVIDRELDAGGDYPTQDEEFVLMHGDSLEMNGFISHLKLPALCHIPVQIGCSQKNTEGKQS